MTSTFDPVFVALGGAGEIGMNLYAYGYGPERDRRWIVVDVGVTFPEEGKHPGVDLIFADVAFLEKQADRIDGIFITHAHEDHVGALPRLAERLGTAPIYARAFTSEIARLKLSESDTSEGRVKTVGAWPETVQAGSFSVGFFPISHSIPESSMLVIDTPAGRILHTGDWKADPTPLVGEPFDPEGIKTLSKDGVLALVCDSTNIFSGNPGRSEADIVTPIEELMRNEPGMIVATTFASNIARLRTLAQAATKAERSVVVIGRAMHRMISTARKVGLLTDFPDILDARDAEGIPAEHLFVLASGSQGEGRAASAQLARGGYGRLSLKDGDVFLFSSKTIPGNEVAVADIQNLLAQQGVRVVDDAGGLYHVSGHANRPDLLAMHKLVNPRGLVPMHGEYRHLAEHARAAEQHGIASVVAPNGTLVALTADGPQLVEHIDTGRLYLDGTQVYGAMDGIVRERLRMSWRGHVVVNLVFDERDALMGDAWVETRGLFTDLDGEEGALQAKLEQVVTDALGSAKRGQRSDDAQVEKLVLGRINTTCQQLLGKKPEITVMINRID
ncbi:MAG: ribonuclease J [Pseudomonadota bacterium]